MTGAAGWLRKPILWVMAAAVVAAFCVYGDYGLTWDEPLFYEYGEAVGYAYKPANWTSGNFDLSEAYGPSAEDHKTRGPGYLLLARLPVRLLRMAGASIPDAWHLVNSLTFVAGVLVIYALSRRLAGEAYSAMAAVLFATQPMLWGHAFINPKDMPFMVLFAAAVWSGWRMVDLRGSQATDGATPGLKQLILPAVLLGFATSTRVLGPLAGLLVLAYWLARSPAPREGLRMLAYAGIAAVVTLATWPYLWEGPQKFAEVFGLMADNPTVLPVLFAGQVFTANALPLRYLPFYMGTTLTEPVWLLCALGAVASWASKDERRGRRLGIALLAAWLLAPPMYVLIFRPPMYDGMRHFLFGLPPAFILGAAGLEGLLRRARSHSLRLALTAAVLLPGVLGIFLLHPYEYTYFNSLIGGTGGAFRRYETDYWLTCYKETVQEFQLARPEPARMFVHREATVAAPYAAANLSVLEERDHRALMAPGDYILMNTRTNEDQRLYRDSSEILSVGRLGATFCVVKMIP